MTSLQTTVFKAALKNKNRWSFSQEFDNILGIIKTILPLCGGILTRTSDRLNEGLPIKMTREKFQRK